MNWGLNGRLFKGAFQHKDVVLSVFGHQDDRLFMIALVHMGSPPAFIPKPLRSQTTGCSDAYASRNGSPMSLPWGEHLIVTFNGDPHSPTKGFLVQNKIMKSLAFEFRC